MANTFTNKHGLPSPLFQLLGRESYSRGNSRRSATQLIDSPRLCALKEKHKDSQAVEVDIADRVWALFGTAVHKLIEDGLANSEWHLTEERIFTMVNGWTISGAVDLQLLGETLGLVDWKVCSIWSVYSAGKPKVKPEWERQLNLLAYLIEREKGVSISQLQIGALIRDWKRSDADRDPGYPQAPFHMVNIPLWSFEEREAYVLERVRLHQEAELALDLGDEPAPCTDEEMWIRDNSWAVLKTGNKRASRVFDNAKDAEDFASTLVSAAVEFRPGARLRCSKFCDAASVCSLAPKPAPVDDGFSSKSWGDEDGVAAESEREDRGSS